MEQHITLMKNQNKINMKTKSITTVLIHAKNKKAIIKQGEISISKLINRSMDLWLSGDETFKALIAGCSITKQS